MGKENKLINDHRLAATASFILGIITLFLMVIFLISIFDYRIITLVPKFVKWFFLLLTIYFFQYGLFFLTTLGGIIFGIFGLKSARKKYASFGIVVSFIGFLFYFFLIIGAYLNNPRF